jgi:polar amino acid transport system substrate-binding protein
MSQKLRRAARFIVRGFRNAAVALTVGLSFQPGAPAGAETLRVYSQAWDGYTNADGTGFGWDVVRAVFSRAETDVEIVTATMPYVRATRSVVSGEAHAWVGAYRDEVPEAVYPEWHYHADRVHVLFKNGRDVSWTGQESLRDKDAVWLLGYAMGRYLDVPVRGSQVKTQKAALRMVANDRVDYYLGTAYEIDQALNDLPIGLTAANLRREPLMNLKLYLGFAPTPEGRRFARIWDEAFPKLLADGTIARLYDRYGFDLWPFEAPRAGPGKDGVASMQ